jgi:hypothetical protein
MTFPEEEWAKLSDGHVDAGLCYARRGVENSRARVDIGDARQTAFKDFGTGKRGNETCSSST